MSSPPAPGRGALLLAGVLAVLIVFGRPAPAHAATWVQNFEPTDLWSGPDSGAVSFGVAQRWDYFEVHAAPAGGRLYVQVVRTGSFAFVDASAVGPSGSPPLGWPGVAPTAPIDEPPSADGLAFQALIGPTTGFSIAADRRSWPALEVLLEIQHTWTLQALASTGTRVEWGVLAPEAAGLYQPDRATITLNVRWLESDPRALAAVVEHEAKHVADWHAGLDLDTSDGCITTEINAFYEEAKTWRELVGPNGKSSPRDDLERSLNYKLVHLQHGPDSIADLIRRNPGYRSQCRLA